MASYVGFEYPAYIEVVLEEDANRILNIDFYSNRDFIIFDYIDSEEFKTIVEGDISNIVNNYLGDNLEPLVGEFLTQIVTYLRDNERVIANALARHEQAITELQNT